MWVTKSQERPHITVEKKHYQAHRLSYLVFLGTIPQGRSVLHSCHTPNCVNPRHLRLAKPRKKVETRVRLSKELAALVVAAAARVWLESDRKRAERKKNR